MANMIAQLGSIAGQLPGLACLVRQGPVAG